MAQPTPNPEQNSQRIPELVLDVFEYAPFERGTSWVLGLVGGGIAISLLFVITEGMAALSLVLAVIIIVALYIQMMRTSSNGDMQQLYFLESGLVHENKYVPYQDLVSFFFFVHPTYTVMHCTNKDRKSPDMVIYLPPEVQLGRLRKGLTIKGLREDLTKKERWADRVVRLLRL